MMLGAACLVVGGFALLAFLVKRAGRSWLSGSQQERIGAILFWASPWARAFLIIGAFAVYLVLLDQALLALPEALSLRVIFSSLFSPLAFFLGVEAKDVPAVADLLGTKLVSNEFVAYVEMANEYREQFSTRTVMLCTFASRGSRTSVRSAFNWAGLGPWRRRDAANWQGWGCGAVRGLLGDVAERGDRGDDVVRHRLRLGVTSRQAASGNTSVRFL